MKTKLLKPIWLAAMLLLLSSVPLTANAHDFEVEGIYYLIDGTNATVTYRGSSYNEYSNEYSGNVVIPESVTYNGATYPVTSIGVSAFRGCSGLTSVTIGNSVTSIGPSAFHNCSGLTGELVIPNSVTSIGNRAFLGCSGLTSINIPNSVTSIGNYAFSSCSGLESITVDSSNPSYDSRNNCNAIIETATNTLISGCKNTVIPNSVISIGSAFSGCTGLTSITIPNSVTSIGNSAFYQCSGLTSVTIPNSVTFIGDYAFYGCSGLTSVTIPNSVTSIGGDAFRDCSDLTSVTIGNSVTSIGNYAFYGCSGLTSVNIGSSVTSIGESAFLGCSGLTSVTIPNSVTSIGYFAFRSCSGLTSVTIGNSVTSIGGYAFSGCSGLTSVTIPNSITSIGGGVFSSCSGLTSVTIPNSVTSIDDKAFYGCIGLTSVTIPNSVTYISDYAFQGCSGLTSITLTGNGYWYYDSNSHQGLRQIINRLKAVNVGSGITSLGNFGFAPDVVNCYAEMPPTCSSSTFANYDGELHVPTNALVPYMTANYWQNFSNLNNDITEKVTLNSTSATLIQHEELQLVVTATPNNSAVIWSSTNQNVATVDNNGKVTAIDQGECDIYATLSTNPAVYASCHITASYPEITALSLNKDSIEFGDAGEAFTLIATTTPANSGPSPTWTSSDETVATVDDNGLVTATGQGECDITATVLDKSVTCHVTVNGIITITLDQHELELDLNHIAVLTPTCSPAETDLTVTSSDPSVVFARMVTQNGTAKVQLVGMKQGEATITVASVDGKAIPDSCVVTVVRRVGDINADGYINVMDITTLIELIMGNVDAPDDAEMPYCDVKADGDINVMDITALIDIIMNSE